MSYLCLLTTLLDMIIKKEKSKERNLIVVIIEPRRPNGCRSHSFWNEIRIDFLVARYGEKDVTSKALPVLGDVIFD